MNKALRKARTQHQQQIAQAKENATNKRHWIKALIQPGINKKLLLALVGKSLQAESKSTKNISIEGNGYSSIIAD